MNFMPDLSPQENSQNMIREMEQVKTLQVTYAVRSTVIDGHEIHEGDRIALGDHGLLAAGQFSEETALEALKHMVDSSNELITIYRGCDAEKEKAEKLADLIQEEFPQVEVDLQQGGQPVYDYLISVE